MTLREIVLIRHGESAANVAAAEAESRGDEVILAPARDSDVELSQTGVHQSEALAPLVPSLVEANTAVFSSTYRRARQTIGIALERAGSDHRVLLDERLRDRELGILDLLTAKGVATRFPEEQQRRDWLGKFSYRPPGGESWADVALRIRSFLRDADGPESAERLVIATHDAVVTLFVYVCTGLDEQSLIAFATENVVANASITTLQRPDPEDSWALHAFSDVSHLVAADERVTTHPGERHD